MKQYE